MIDREVQDAINSASASLSAAVVGLSQLLIHKGIITQDELDNVLTNMDRPSFSPATEALYQQVIGIILRKPDGA